MSFRQFFSRISFFAVILMGSVVSSWGMGNHKNEVSRGRVPLANFHEHMKQSNSTPDNLEKTKGPSKGSKPCVGFFNPEIIEEIQLALESAPSLAKQIVKHLKNIHFINDSSFRVSIFWGTPGTGKTMTALGIAHEMCKTKGWKYLLISSGALAKEHRNATAVYLEKILKEIEEDDTPTLLIIDEMNELLENTQSEYHDTSVTSKLLWTFLDRQRGNHNFFCIGTMNQIDKLAEPFKDRYLSKCIEFLPIVDTLFRNKLLVRKLSDDYTRLHAHVTHPQLNDLLQPLGNCSGRTVQEIASLCRLICRLNDSESTDLIITSDYIAQAVARIIHLRLVGKYGQHQESDTEQRERHHVEQLGQSNRHHVEQSMQNAQQFADTQAEQLRQFRLNLETQRGLSRAQLEQAATQFEEQQRVQQLNFVQNIRAQSFTSTNQIGIGGGASKGAGEGGAGGNASISIGNIGFKEHLLNYVLTDEQLEINADLERRSDPRPTTIAGSIFGSAKRAVLNIFSKNVAPEIKN